MKQKFYPNGVVLTILLFPFVVCSQQFSLLKDIKPGSNGSTYFNFTNVNGVLFFRPDDGIHGDELWKTDGTEAGTVMVKDINPGASGSGLDMFTNVNGILFFRADDGIHGTEVWKSDGTEAGTVLVKDIVPGVSSSVPAVFFNANGLLLFSIIDGNGRELWKSDGTEAGTIMVKDIFPGMATSPVIGSYPQSGNPSDFTLMNGFVYFGATDGILNGRKLWRTDGTTEGTTIVKNVDSGTFPLYNFININGVLFFTVYGGNNYNSQLWKSDGTEAGTALVTAVGGYEAFTSPTDLNGSLCFFDDGLWKSDGTAAGTALLKQRASAYYYSPEIMRAANGLLYFTGYDATNGWELWKSDGTIGGTALLKDINAGISNSEINTFVRTGNKLMFTAVDGIHGNEIWVSDGTPGGTRLVQDIEPGTVGSDPTEIIEVNGKIFAGVLTSEFGREVWVTNLPAESPLPLEFLEFKGSIVNGNGLLQWKTDNESNTDAFIVERSVDGSDYKAIGSVASASRPGVQNYNYTDVDIVSLGSPVFYYRLKQTDIDGRYTYPNIVTLTVENREILVRLYPNPVKNTINLTINVPEKQRLQWQLADNGGRIVKRGLYDLSPGSIEVRIDIPELSSGIYFMQLKGSTLQQVIKVIKQ